MVGGQFTNFGHRASGRLLQVVDRMSDVFDSAKRSEVMSRIRGKGNRSTEIALVSVLRSAGITGWRRHITLKLNSNSPQTDSEMSAKLLVTPDFQFRKVRLAIFVDGCFWHQCQMHSKIPKNNRDFWKIKLRRNVERDQEANRALRAAGWRVLRLWEHELREPKKIVSKIRRRLSN